ncbi:MAG: ATP-binding protein [Lachnospiraceae bacterium]|nr:ATP-binding protein [Lachnospiraceae bacterium]MBP5183978.1 ATP-binding protein [Lachnospiraceae bacterium]
MSLMNQQIDVILREYDKIRTANNRIMDLRKQEVYLRVPKIKEIDEQIASESVNWLTASLDGAPSDIAVLKGKLAELSSLKDRLLKEAGFAKDYLDPVYTCPECKDTGFIDNQKCTCFRNKLIKHLYDGSNMKNAVPYENFGTFDFSFYSDIVPEGKTLSPLANIKKAVEKSKLFVHNFDKEFSNLLITGNTGVGKTFLCNCIAKALMESGHSVVYQTEYELFDSLKANVFSKDDPEAGSRYDCIAECDLLIIDDLGVGFNNSLLNAEFFKVLNERLLTRRSTLISTNLHLEDIKNNYSERVLSRIIGSYDFIEIYGDDIRKLKKISGGQSNGQAAGKN